MKAIVFLLASLILSSAFAVAPANCNYKNEYFDGTQVQTNGGSRDCYVSISSRNAYVDLIYRSFLFSSDGLLMVFNSFGDGPESQTTAARDFNFFPRGQFDLAYQYDAATKKLFVRMPNGKVATFDTQKAVLESISGSVIQQDYMIVPENRGGIEIISNDSLFMDGGFKMGQSPSQNPKGKVVFKDAQQNSCELVNADVYRYTSDDDSVFKFNDVQLKAFLSKRCPQLRY